MSYRRIAYRILLILLVAAAAVSRQPAPGTSNVLLLVVGMVGVVGLVRWQVGRLIYARTKLPSRVYSRAGR
jgi:uncharacterized protein involved in response to NO